MSAWVMLWVQWALDPVGVDVNVYVRQRVHGCHPDGGESTKVAYVPLDLMYPHLDLMSPTLESAMLPLECAPLDIAQPTPGCTPLEVVLSGFGKICSVFRVFQALWFSGGWVVAAM